MGFAVAYFYKDVMENPGCMGGPSKIIFKRSVNSAITMLHAGAHADV
jgi:hypothetical protein